MNPPCPLDRELTITTFADRAAWTATPEPTTLRAFAERIRTTTASAKDSLPWLKLAIFGDHRSAGGSLRNNANVLLVDGIEGDYDLGTVTAAEACDRLRAAGLAAVVYTSPSHTDAAPRWRVLCPCSDSLAPDARRALVGRLNAVLGGVLARESFVLSQAYYLGSVNRNPAHVVHLIDGEYIDLVAGIEPVFPPAASTIQPLTVPTCDEPTDTASATLTAACALFTSTTGTADGRHQVLLRATAAIAPFVLAGHIDQDHAEADITAAMSESGREPYDGEVSSAMDGALRHAKPYEPPVDATEDFGADDAIPEPPRDWRLDQQFTARGGIRPNLFNALLAVRHARCLALNDFADTIVYTAVPPWDHSVRRGQALCDADAVLAAVWLQTMDIQVAPSTAFDALVGAAREHRFDPVRGWLSSLAWDGAPRIDTWLTDHLGAENTPYNRAVAGKMLIASVARVFRPGCKVDTVGLLEGSQGIGKSSTLQELYGSTYFTDHMPDLSSKDAMAQLAGMWCIEFAELDKLNRAESARAKSFISTAADRFRRAYGRVAETVPRRCVFWGTVNPGAGYLTDETGNRRYWPVRCGPDRVDLSKLQNAREQIWAEAVARYQLGETWWMDTKALGADQEQMAAARFAEDAWSDLIREFATGRDTVSVRDVLSDCIHKPRAQWNQADQNRVARTLVSLGATRKQVRVGARREWRYILPESSPVVTGQVCRLVTEFSQ